MNCAVTIYSLLVDLFKTRSSAKVAMNRIHSHRILRFTPAKGALLIGATLLTSAFSICLEANALPFIKVGGDDENPLSAPDVIPKPKFTKEQQAQYTAAIKNGQAYLKQNQIPMAKMCFQGALELDPNSVDGHIGMAICRSDEADLAPAQFELTEALRVQPSNVEARFLLGQLMMKEAHWDEAGGQFLQILKYDGNNHAARGNLAVCLQQLGQVDPAILQYKIILEKNPKSAEAAYNLGAAYEHKKLLDEAMFYYKKATEIDPNYANAYCAIAKCFVANKRYAEALTLLGHAEKINPKNFYCWHVKGYVYEQMNKKTEAIKCYTTAIAQNPNNWDSKRSLQRILEKGHEKELAELKRLQKPQ